MGSMVTPKVRWACITEVKTNRHALHVVICGNECLVQARRMVVKNTQNDKGVHFTFVG